MAKWVFSIILWIGLLAPSFACDGPYQNKVLNRTQVKSILKENPQANLCKAILDGAQLSQMNFHGVNFEQASMKRVKLKGSDLSRANLNEADLSEANLEKAYFRWASLNQAILHSTQLKETVFMDATAQNADFSRAQLKHTNFTHADLTLSRFTLTMGENAIFERATLLESDFRLAKLANSHFFHVNAKHADFTESELPHSDFTKSDLSNAIFKQSRLKQARFDQTILHETNFEQADLENVYYHPSLTGIPNLTMLATAKHFETIDFYNSKIGAPALRALQVAYKQAGIRPMQRLITSMIKQHQMQSNFDKGGLKTIEALFSYVLFYLPGNFGLYPGKALFYFFWMMVIFSLPYYWSLGAHSPHSGIIVAWPSRRDSSFLLEASYQHFVKIHEDDPWIIRTIKRYRRLLSAVYFSLLSSFQVGWQDFNVAKWITLIQTKEYQYIARGWVRTLAGIQSILSAYLLVLWALTYFGSPFEW